MTKDEVKQIIRRYSMGKILIISALWLAIIIMIVSVLAMSFVKYKWISYVGIVSYIVMLAIIFIAVMFPLGKPLTEFISLDDYKAILQYLNENAENLNMNEYFDGMLMIKGALNKTVYHAHLNGLDNKLVEHLRYLQGFVFREDKEGVIPKKLQNRLYVKTLSGLLLQQINDGQFKELEIEKIDCKENNVKKRHIYINSKNIYLLCTVILICIVLTKIVFSVNETLYDLTSSHIFVRVFYNVGADVIAIYYAIREIRNK